MNAMPLAELIQWRERARERWELQHGARSKTTGGTARA
ncbi:GpE family phage tail protein [Ectopseudomonas oleovorans]